AGVFGISLVVALTAGALAWLTWRPRSSLSALGLALLLWAGGFGLQQVQWTEPSGDWQTVALVQGDIDQRTKWSREAVQQALDHYMSLSRGHWDADLVIWPETAIPDFYHAVKPALDQIGDNLKAMDTTLVTGLIRRDPETGRLFNSAVLA